MSTIERALEKQRQLEEAKQRKIPGGSQEAPSLKAQQELPAKNQAHSFAEPKAAEDNGSWSGPERQPSRQCTIDLKRLERMGMVNPSENFSQIKEEYRYIKRPLLNNAFGPQRADNANLIMVTSSFPGEGKTFNAINLAISMALEHDRQVLLVDADVIKPQLGERLGLDASLPGLMDYLKGEVSVEDIFLNTNIPNLRVVTAGGRYHHSNEMVASAKMATFMEELSTRYSDRVVVFDSSPLQGASETKIIAQMTGQAVLVVEELRTTQKQVEQSLNLLGPNTKVGLILNKAKIGRKDYYGYYHASTN
ncbi:XrtA-associated tyrosine autokinase [Motiliproteus sp. SC1-56]|uniref:XrtA-associated tyrosine autokinase n=1 Tax=Motiliproteus sp. SC1-56 TaxID=2799565 RepID=UPI001A8CAC6F|nr:XrtA-associated tyrosine autokinase [Motiliproteus sp. SC1-56]